MRLIVAFAMLALQGCADGQSDEAPTTGGNLSDTEFREVVRSLSETSVSEERLAAVLRRASTQQGSALITAATLPRRSGHDETILLLARIWNEQADDIPLAAEPTFRLSVASALHRLDEKQCAGCYRYARSLLSAGESKVRAAAALAMAELGSVDDVETLRQLIISDEISVAASAATALTGLAQDPIPMLQSLMSDAAVSSEKRAMLTQVIEGVERRQSIIENLRAR
jgi:hypothetical protein